jgi:hypothetical protein
MNALEADPVTGILACKESRILASGIKQTNVGYPFRTFEDVSAKRI